MKEHIDPYKGTPFSLFGKISIITGGAGLLGREFSLALLSAGSSVIIVDNDADKLEKFKKELLNKYSADRLDFQLVDITDSDSINKFIKHVNKKYNYIDILVNSAAIDPKFEKDSDVTNLTKFIDYPKELWEKSLSVNLTGAFLLTQKVCIIMEKRGKGVIINIGSNYGLVGPDQRIYKKKGEKEQTYKSPDYSVCKAGLIGFTKFLAAYYAGTNIRVNMLTPSGIYNNHEKEFNDNYSRNTILRRMSKKEEYWGGIIFLASDASSYMTGANLVIDGGWTAL